MSKEGMDMSEAETGDTIKLKFTWTYEFEVDKKLYPEHVRDNPEKIIEIESGADFDELLFKGEGSSTLEAVG